jgi:RND family efflux transporter, MFP subunit
MWNKQALCFGLVCCFSVLVFSCGRESKVEGSSNATFVKVVRPELKSYCEELASFGTISYKTKNDVSALVEGTMIRLLVKEGDAIRQGQVLAELRNVQLELQRDQAQNEIASANAALSMLKPKKWEIQLSVENKLLSLQNIDIELVQKDLELKNAREKLEKDRELLDIGGITDSTFKSEQLSVLSQESAISLLKNQRETAMLGLRDSDLLANGMTPSTNPETRKKQLIALNSLEIDAEIDSAQAKLKNAYNSLSSVSKLIEELTIRSPVSGILGAKYFESGEFVKQNEKLFTIIDISKVTAVFSIQEQDVVYFSVGSQLSLDIQALDRKIQAKITEISPMADPQSGNFTIKADIVNRAEKIKPGMFVKCLIPKKENEMILCLPASAIVKKSGEKCYAYCVVGSLVVCKEVSVRAIKDGNAWIDSGLAEKDSIVDSPSPFLKEGTNVKID